MRSTLFEPNTVEDYVLNLRDRIKAEIEKMPENTLKANEAKELGRQLAQNYQVDCPVLLEDRIEIDEPEFTPNSPFVMVNVHIPFTGNKDMFRCHGRDYPIMGERFEVRDGELVMGMRVEAIRISESSTHITATLKRVKQGLQHIQDQLKHFNPDLEVRAIARIQERLAEFTRHHRVVGKLEESGFRLRRREDEPARVVVSVKPRPIAVQTKPRPHGAPTPELDLADYDAILEVIQNMVKVFERSPSVFKEMEEEDLRTILLVALNGVFQGQATGETFNGIGKTDIMIRVNNDNVFIGECLIWDGPTKFQKKVTDQLFGYSTWSDSKLAAIVFNRNKNFTAVVNSINETIGKLPNIVQTIAYATPNSCRHKFHRADDPQKVFVLTCMAFEVPS